MHSSTHPYTLISIMIRPSINIPSLSSFFLPSFFYLSSIPIFNSHPPIVFFHSLSSHLSTRVPPFLSLILHCSISTMTYPPHSAPLFFPNPGNRLQIPASTTNIANTIGISTQTPLACAIAPTANGKIVAPAAPNAAANPMPPTCRCLGRSFVAATTAAGKRGPMKNPSMAMPVAEAGKLGTSQKRRWAATAKKR